MVFEKGHKTNVGKIPWNKGKTTQFKGKTYLEIYGDKAEEEIKKRKCKRKNCGEKHHGWLGGKSMEEYSKQFTRKFKRLIRERDNYLCLKCGLSEIESKKISRFGLDVHHINYNKLMTIPENCCSLCHKCNTEVNFNRIAWIHFFQERLSNLYGYKYEDEEIILDLNNNERRKQ